MASKDSSHLAPPQTRWTWDQLVNEVVDNSPAPTRPNSMYVGGNPFTKETRKDNRAQDATQTIESVQKNGQVKPSAQSPELVQDGVTSTSKPSPKRSNFIEAPDHDIEPEAARTELDHGIDSLPTTARTSTVVPKISEEAMTISRAFSDLGDKDLEISIELGKSVSKEARLSHAASASGSSTVNEDPEEVAPTKPAENHPPTGFKVKGGIEEMDMETGSRVEQLGVVTKAPYSAFPVKAKRLIVLGAASASVFAPLSMQIYMPSLNDLVDEFDVSRIKINLTVSVYMIFMAISPMVIGGLADITGRRPALMFCFAIYIVSCVLLALCNGYAQLMAFRIIQSIGASPTIAIASAVVADIVTSAERGSYAALVAVPVIFAPTLGPVIGGLLTQYLGWRAIFWFLLIAGGIALFLIMLFFPETCRVIVGDASARPPKLYQTALQAIRKDRPVSTETATLEKAKLRGLASRKKMMWDALTSGITVLFTKERFYLLIYVGIIFSGFNAIATEIPTQFKAIYGYDSLMVGIMYLPMAGGAMISTIIIGRQMNKNFRKHAARQGINIEEGQQVDMNEFPAERARLEVTLPSLFICTAGLICWGWVLEQKTSVAAPCVLLFFLGVGLNGVMASTNALLMDISQTQAGAVMAASNLTRCALGAVASAVIQPMIDRVGIQWAYMIYGCVYLLFAPLLALQYFKGHQWRRQAKDREDKKNERQLAEDVLSGHVSPAVAETRSIHSQHGNRDAHEGLTALRFSTLQLYPSRPDLERSVVAAADALMNAPAIPLVPVSRPATVKEKSARNSISKD
ncbi:Quinidine resistance protein 1 [Cytospora mali]|uniref:Quinidine resistance protein 1 n=1 Tax=Cytospora mali TaxID=578113 RepID=A0A194URF0_CYTMA|nr:Quinidine resistance protein 1 [Valsa mali var. pyri (nom. inval.)]